MGNDMNGFTVITANRKTPWDSGETWSSGQTAAAAKRIGLATSAQMLDAAGMAGWDVQKVQLHLPDGRPVPRRYATVRSDNGAIVGGNVGEHLKVWQNEQVFSFGDEIVKSKEAHWGRAGGFGGGAVTFACMELDKLHIKVPGDAPLDAYFLIVNSFDGSRPLTGLLAQVRPVCVNTFQMALATATPYKFTIRHTGDLDQKREMAREAIGIATRHIEESKPIIERLALTKLVDAQVRELFETLWPISDEADESDREKARATQAMNNYLASPTLNGIRGTAWGAFNGVTEYTDHLTKYAGKSTSTAADVRGTSLLFGVGAETKTKALRELVALAR
jgi:phage/plasmid-like protein (TIGR03299 family)